MYIMSAINANRLGLDNLDSAQYSFSMDTVFQSYVRC